VTQGTIDLLARLGGPPPPGARTDLVIERNPCAADLRTYRLLRRLAFVDEQGLFDGNDLDERDHDAATIVLVARSAGAVVGGVRLSPERSSPELAWWRGSRLVCHPALRAERTTVGRALVGAACALAEAEGALRFDATVQPARERFFRALGWERTGETAVAGVPHVTMRRPIDRIATLVEATKAPLAGLVGSLRPEAGWVGDDGVPIPGSDVVAATDAITPAMVERDPEWAGWCGLLVCANDLAAMGAAGIGALDALSAPSAAHAHRVLSGVRKGSQAFGLPILGGHTQIGAPASLAVTALGRTATPVPGGGGRPGDEILLTADLEGGWRPGYTGAQWDSTSGRTREEIAAMLGTVAAAGPAAAKDVSMAGIVGTLGMLAEASGCGAVLRVADVPRPPAARLADWLTCFPGFAMLTAQRPGSPAPAAGPARSAVCGHLTAGSGVTLVWPDGERTRVLDGPVTGLGRAGTP
jgi:putative N-acetyltransferase (TIGR04045 family)